MARGIRKKFWSVKPPIGSQVNRGHSLADGLIGCWLFNETQGTIAFNCNNLSHILDGALTSEVTWQNRKFGTEVKNKGTNGQGISCGYVAEIGNSQQQSIFAIVNPRLASANGGIIDQTGAGSTNSKFLLFQEGALWKLRNQRPAGADTLNFNTAPKVGEYQSLGGTIPQSQKSGENGLFAYFNGAPDGATTTSLGVAQANVSSGALLLGELGSTIYAFDGQIVLIYLWLRPLQSAAFRELHANPYCFISPPAPRIRYFITAAAAAAPLTTTKLSILTDSKLSVLAGTKVSLKQAD